MPTMPLVVAGQTIEPSVSVPTASGARLAATAAPEPELEPHGLRSSAYGLRHCPPRALQPRDRARGAEVRPLATGSSCRGSPRPPSRRRSATKRVRGGIEPSSASEPAVVAIRSAVSMLSLSSTGMPCSGPRGPFAFRSASSASAIASASGLVSMTERSCGPARSSALDALEVGLGDQPRAALARRHLLLQLGDRRLLEREGGDQ